MAKKKELTVEERLRALYDLQLIDSRVDEIRNVRGELPLEVRDLEDEVEGFKLRLQTSIFSNYFEQKFIVERITIRVEVDRHRATR